MTEKEALYRLIGTQEFDIVLNMLRNEALELDKISTPMALPKDFETITSENKVVATYVGKILAKEHIEGIIYRFEHYDKFLK